MVVLVLTWLAFGLLVGLMARATLPGRHAPSLLGTTLLGIAGSLLGGLVGNLVVGEAVLRLHPAGFIGSLLGALGVLALIGMTQRNRLAA